MAGLMTLGGGKLTPEQIKELQLRQSMVRSPQGQFIPRAQPLGGPPAGLLGVDPVATQAQSRANPNTPKAKPFYVDPAGNVGRSIPAGSGANVAYSATQGAKAAVPGLLRQGAGLLGRAALGPVSLGASLLGGGTGLSADDQMPMAAFSPEEIADAHKFAQRTRDMATAGMPPTGADLLMKGVKQPPPGAPQGAAWPDLPVAEPADAPAVNPNLAAEQALLQTRVKSQLESGDVSKPKLAARVVDAKIAQSGEKVSKGERDKLVKEETGFFRSMDEDTVAKYVSTIMMAGGVYAAMMGDSQSAQALFGQANTMRGEKAARAREEAAAAAALRKEEREERKVAATEADVGSKVQYRGTQGAVAEQELGLREEGLEDTRARTGIMANRAESESELARVRAERIKAQTAFDEQKLKIDQQRADAYAKGQTGAGKGVTAPALTYPQNQELAESYFKAQGIEADKGVLEATAQQLINLQKNYPDLTVDEQMALVTEQFEATPGKVNPFWFDDKPKLSLPK